jgi:cytochrome c biogenesis protein CcmG, thiol:disulfide interchange protein DsbE
MIESGRGARVHFFLDRRFQPMRFLHLVILLCVVAGAPAASAADEGSAAPPFDAQLFDGRSFSLEAEKGKVVVINFWATWCAPCRAEMPALDEYYRAHRSEGVEILAVSVDSPKDEAKARDVMKAFAMPAAFARESTFKGYGRIWRLPLTFVIDRAGVLRREGWYADPGIDATLLDQVVTPLLRQR